MLQKMEKISIIIPLYNTAEYIGRCIDSVLGQGVDAQIIVVDDCSTDSSREIVRGYGERVRLICQPQNRRQAAARNVGMEVMTGDWFFFLDSDDELAEGALQDMLVAATEEDVDWVEGAFKTVYEDRTVIQSHSKGRYSSAMEVARNFDKLNFSNVTAKLFNSRLKDIRFDEQIYFEDELWIMEAYRRVQTIKVIEKPVYIRYVRQGSTMMSRYSEAKIESLLKITERICASNPDKNQQHKAVYAALTLIKNIYITDFPKNYRKEILRKLFATGVCKMYCNRDVLPPLTGAMSLLLPMRRRWVFELLFKIPIHTASKLG